MRCVPVLSLGGDIHGDRVGSPGHRREESPNQQAVPDTGSGDGRTPVISTLRMRRLTAFVRNTTMALVEDGASLGSRQLDMGNSGQEAARLPTASR